MTSDEWHEKLAALPSKEIHRLLKHEPAVTAQISAGFRPSPETLKNPLVLKRLAQVLPQNPKLSEALASIEPTLAPTKSTQPAPKAARGAHDPPRAN